MNLINVKCPNCGESIQVETDRESTFCSYCGNKVEIKVPNELHKKAIEARDANDNKNAQRYYEMILAEEPDNWDAKFFVLYYQGLQCKEIDKIFSIANSIRDCEKHILERIKRTIKQEDQLFDAINQIYSRLGTVAFCLSTEAKISSESIKVQSISSQSYALNVYASSEIMYELGNLIELNWGDTLGYLAAGAWSDAIDIEKESVKHLNKQDAVLKRIDFYVQRILKYDSTYQKPKIEGKKGCYVATSIYGSYDCPQVWTLRRFRDDTLDASWFGRCFIKTYYAISPTLVKWFGKSAIFKGIFTPILDNMVKSLKDKGISDKPYNDKY